jgi:hypothetical protein
MKHPHRQDGTYPHTILDNTELPTGYFHFILPISAELQAMFYIKKQLNNKKMKFTALFVTGHERQHKATRFFCGSNSSKALPFVVSNATRL